LSIPRDPEVRYVVDFGAPKPYSAYLREHSPDYGTYKGVRARNEDTSSVPGFRPASELIREPPKLPFAPRPSTEIAHEDADTTASPEAGRAWASGQLVFNAGHSFRVLGRWRRRGRRNSRSRLSALAFLPSTE